MSNLSGPQENPVITVRKGIEEMEIRKLFGQQDAVNRTDAKKKEAAVQQNEQNTQGAAERAGQDVVSVSALSRQLLQISNVLDEDSRKRTERVAELKKRVDEGSYSVDSSDVAASMVSFASELTPLREF